MSTHQSDFNRRLEELRKDSGRSLDDAWADARAVYPDVPSRSTIARLEKDPEAEEKADPVVVAALATVYGVSLDEMSPRIAERSRRAALVLVGGAGWAARDSNPEPAESMLVAA